MAIGDCVVEMLLVGDGGIMLVMMVGEQIIITRYRNSVRTTFSIIGNTETIKINIISVFYLFNIIIIIIIWLGITDTSVIINNSAKASTTTNVIIIIDTAITNSRGAP